MRACHRIYTRQPGGLSACQGNPFGDDEGYAKLSLKKYKPIAARNEDEKVFNGLR
jgi:hypothetical protein